jgi:hypothetical protein
VLQDAYLLAAVDERHKHGGLDRLRGLVDDHHVERAGHARESGAAGERKRARHDVRLLQHRRAHALLLPGGAAAALALRAQGLG